jgi:hypothetical protein
MGISKVDYNNETLIDISNDTVTPQTLAKGYTAHNSNGERIVGTMTSEGGSGSGIIDVTELPTEGIDENAVYRVTESIQTNINEIYLNEGDGTVRTVQEALFNIGLPIIPNVYFVDELPVDMLPTDLVTYSQMHFYALRTNGIVYMYSSAHGATITLGFLLTGDFEHDKGSTENAYAETEIGVYTTLETFKDVERYFIRKNGAWVELGLPCSADIIDELNAPVYITEDYFRRKDGTYVTHIKPYAFFHNLNLTYLTLPQGLENIGSDAFSYCESLRKVVIPSSVKVIEGLAFDNCDYLSKVTFEGTPNEIHQSAFTYCRNLTTINVPWSEGEVADAPWGAGNATINYNYTEG